MLNRILGRLGMSHEKDGFSFEEEHYNAHIKELSAGTQAAVALALAEGKIDFLACADPTLNDQMPDGRGLRIAGGMTALSEDQFETLVKENPNLLVLGHEACGFVFSGGSVTGESQFRVNSFLDGYVCATNAKLGTNVTYEVQKGGSAPLRNKS